MRFSENEGFNEKKYLEELYKKMREEKIQKEKLIMEIKSNDDYINWLSEFTKKYPYFKEWYIPNVNLLSLREIDRVNMQKLSLLYEMIDIYAKENYLYPNDRELNSYYIVKHNNIYYLVGRDYSFGGNFRLEKVPREKVNEINSYLEYRDIQTNKKQPNTDIIKIQLASLSNMIYEYANRIPIKAIKEKVEDTILDIEENLEKEKVKVKKI